MKLPVYVLLYLISTVCSYAQLEQFVTYGSNEIFLDHVPTLQGLLKAPSKTFYSKERKYIQKRRNSIAESIVCYSPETDQLNWNSIDHEDITPHTWKWVQIDIDHLNGDESVIVLRRPLWWLRKHQIETVGEKVYLDIEEFGIKGDGIITKMYASQIDTRLWDEKRVGDFVCRPIIGKYIHTSHHVINLQLKDGVEIAVTENHPIWSADRNDWVEAGDLKEDEAIRTNSGFVKIRGKQKLNGSYTVYNIEVYRSHNYFASRASILAHNGPCGIDIYSQYWNRLTDKAMRDTRYLTNRYITNMASQKVGDDYNVVLFYIQKINNKNPAGSFTDAMELLINEAKQSGAKRINIVASTVINQTLFNYFKHIDLKFTGITVTRQGPSFVLVGNVDDIQRIPLRLPPKHK